MAPVVTGLQNNQVYYVVILREQGAAYYTAALPAPEGSELSPNCDQSLSTHSPMVQPSMQASIKACWAKLALPWTQGFTASTPSVSPSWQTGTAQPTPLTRLKVKVILQSQAELGGWWRACMGQLIRAADGLSAGKDAMDANVAAAMLDPAERSGLIHLVFDAPTSNGSVRIIWRGRECRELLDFRLNQRLPRINVLGRRKTQTIAVLPATNLRRQGRNAIQVLDDGRQFAVYLNGTMAFGRWFADDRLSDATAIGVAVGPGAWKARRLEAHPHTFRIPPQFNLGAPWASEGTRVIVADDFRNGQRGDLHGRRTPVGDRIWCREIGVGTFETSGNDVVRVVATLARPCPSRTAYSVSWDNREIADVRIDLTPPGTSRHQGHRGRGGILFWQDPANYIIVSTWLDDTLDTASLSSFFFLRGFEDVYDAVWSNLSTRVRWGERYAVRVVFDGTRFVGYVNGEPVLFRALADVYPDVRRLSINRVGIVANWEWGNDTGSEFHRFVAMA